MINTAPHTPIDEANHKRPLILKPLNQPQESKSSYFPYRLVNTDSSLPDIPSITTPPTTTINSITTKDGSESESSEEGRKTSSMRLGLRVTNPDVGEDGFSVDIAPQTVSMIKLQPVEAETVDQVTKIDEPKEESQLSLSVQVTPCPAAKEEGWKVSESYIHEDQSPVPLQRRVSKTLAIEDEIAHRREETNQSANHGFNLYEAKSPFENNKQRTLQENCSTSCHTSSDNCSAIETLSSTIPKTNTQQANEQARNNMSRYAKVSFHLTNDPTAIKQYREMAEKGNDTTTQLIFAKYLLETANAFYPPKAANAPPKIVGSLWGVGATTKKSQRPQPFLVVPTPDDEISSIRGNSTTSSLNATHSVRSTSLATVLTAKQPHILDMAVMDESRKQKIKTLEEEAVKWIKRLAKENVGEACYMLANWMDKELYGFKNNRAKSLQLHSIASKSHIPESVFIVAQHYEEEGKVPPVRILKLYQSAVKNDYVNAIYVR
jgi:hypothetical protein